MATQYITGWEVGHLEGEPHTSSVNKPATVGNAVLDTTIVRTGTYSLKVNPASGAAGYWEVVSGGGSFQDTYMRVYVRITTLPSSTARVLLGRTVAGQINILLNPTGTLSLRSNTTVQGTSTTALTDPSKWYRIEVKNLGSTSAQELRIDGASEVSVSLGVTSLTLRWGADDTVADTYTAYFDDCVWDTAAYPGDGKVALLVPVSDNARDTLWTAGAGGTTNLFEAVNNIPPIGTASETNLTQIEHAGGASGTTDRYDANLMSYTDAGIASGDTVNAVMPFIAHGEDASAGTKNVSFEILSNPAISSSGPITVGNDQGALGTFPTNWWVNRINTVATSPSVTLGTSPVMRVVRPETASRVVSVCFMGMYVDYTPAQAPPVVAAAIPLRRFRMMRGLGR